MGYVLQKNANQEAHVRDRIKRVVAAMGVKDREEKI